jgi:small subunit ribosomal protein S17
MARTLTGKVVSLSTPKTIVVAVQESRRHKIYDKQYFVTKRFKVHDEKNQAGMGDKVNIAETTPISRHKRWTLKTIVETAEGGKK